MWVKINDHIIQMTIPWGIWYYSDSFCNYIYSIIDVFKIHFFSIWIYFILRSFRSFGFHCREGVEEGAIKAIILTVFMHLHQNFLSNVFKNREEAIWFFILKKDEGGTGEYNSAFLSQTEGKKKTFKNYRPISNHCILSHRSLWVIFYLVPIT